MDEHIDAFWSWFCGIAGRLEASFDTPALLRQLDHEVRKLGNLAWELGPGVGAENALTLSPDGDPELLQLTERIVARAPALPRWELFDSRQPREPAYVFSLGGGASDDLAIDASGWRYALLRYRDGGIGLVLEQGNLAGASEADRYLAACILVDGLLGERRRLRWVTDVQPVRALADDLAAKANPVTVLVNHLRQLVAE